MNNLETAYIVIINLAGELKTLYISLGTKQLVFYVLTDSASDVDAPRAESVDYFKYKHRLYAHSFKGLVKQRGMPLHKGQITILVIKHIWYSTLHFSMALYMFTVFEFSFFQVWAKDNFLHFCSFTVNIGYWSFICK